MARSVSRIRFVHVVFLGFCMLYWSPKSSISCSSLVNRILVKLTVRGYGVGCLPWGWCAVFFVFPGACPVFCSDSRNECPFLFGGCH